MYNGAFSPIIQTPLSASGVDNLFVRQNSPMIFAGGTHIMREVMNYPNVTVPKNLYKRVYSSRGGAKSVLSLL